MSSTPQPHARGGQTRRDGALGDADDVRGCAVVVAVLVDEHDEDALLHRQVVERVLQVGPAGDDVAGVVVAGGVGERVLAGQHLEAPLAAEVVEARGVGDAVEPRADLAVSAEPAQRLVGLDGRVLERVVHESGVAEDAEREGAQAAVVVLEHAHERLRVAALRGADGLLVDLAFCRVVGHSHTSCPSTVGLWGSRGLRRAHRGDTSPEALRSGDCIAREEGPPAGRAGGPVRPRSGCAGQDHGTV